MNLQLENYVVIDLSRAFSIALEKPLLVAPSSGDFQLPQLIVSESFLHDFQELSWSFFYVFDSAL